MAQRRTSGNSAKSARKDGLPPLTAPRIRIDYETARATLAAAANRRMAGNVRSGKTLPEARQLENDHQHMTLLALGEVERAVAIFASRTSWEEASAYLAMLAVAAIKTAPTRRKLGRPSKPAPGEIEMRIYLAALRGRQLFPGKGDVFVIKDVAARIKAGEMKLGGTLAAGNASMKAIENRVRRVIKAAEELFGSGT